MPIKVFIVEDKENFQYKMPWRNFHSSIEFRTAARTKGQNDMKTLLDKYHCRYINLDFMEFEEEKYLTQFLLKWS